MSIGIGSDWGNETPAIERHQLEYESKIRIFQEHIEKYDKDLKWAFEHMGYSQNILSLIKRPNKGLEIVYMFPLNLDLHDYTNQYEMKCRLIDDAWKRIFKEGLDNLKNNK